MIPRRNWRVARALLGLVMLAAPPIAGSDLEIRAGAPATPAAIESQLAPLFARKDFGGLPAAKVLSEAAGLLREAGLSAQVRWWPLAFDPFWIGLLTVDPGAAQPPAADHVSYAIVERAATGGKGTEGPSISWYHDLGQRLADQAGARWHPVDATAIPGAPPDGRGTVLVHESDRVGGSPIGLLALSFAPGRGWQVSARVSPAARHQDAVLIGAGREGAVFRASRKPPKGVLTGAPASLFQALVLYERRGETFASEPILAPLPDVVGATEALIAAMRTGDKDGAIKLCRSPDLLDALRYFSPTWGGGGRVVGADDRRLEIVYEERGRPTLRIEFHYENEGGSMHLVSVTGRAEAEAGPGRGGAGTGAVSWPLSGGPLLAGG